LRRNTNSLALPKAENMVGLLKEKFALKLSVNSEKCYEAELFTIYGAAIN